MKSIAVKIAVLAVYCVPFPFLAVWGDGTHGTMLLYGIMIAAYFSLGMVCYRTGNGFNMFIGGIAGGVLSLAAVKISDLSVMDHYFKPFTAFGVTTVVSAAEIIVNAVAAALLRRRKRLH